jgi:hypothetical protein
LDTWEESAIATDSALTPTELANNREKKHPLITDFITTNQGGSIISFRGIVEIFRANY